MNVGSSLVLDILFMVLEWMPYFVVFALGAVASVVVYLRERAAGLLLFAAVVLLTSRALGYLVVSVFSLWVFRSGLDPSFYAIIPWVYALRSLLSTVVTALAWSALIAATVVGRDSQTDWDED